MAPASTSRTAFLVLILMVGCGLILSLIRMSEAPSTPIHRTNVRMGDYRDDYRDDFDLDVGPTDIGEAEQFGEIYTEPVYVGEEHMIRTPPFGRPSVDPSEASTVTPTMTSTSSEPFSPSSGYSIDKESQEPDDNEEFFRGESELESERETVAAQAASEISDYIESEITDYLESESTDYLESESTDYIENESTDYLESESTDYLESEITDYIENESTDYLESESTDYLESEITDYIESEITDYIENESTDYLENESTDHLESGANLESEITDHLESESTDSAAGQQHVLLLTEGRSGSTWLSSFFWNQKSVFYVYEPLFNTGSLRSRGCHDSEVQRRACDVEVLSHLWGCDFHSSDLSVRGRYKNYHVDCEWRNCSSTKGREEDCRAASHVVAKTILLFDLANIEEIVRQTDKYNVKVIHLVRDPRPLVQSRQKGSFGSLDGIHKHTPYTDEDIAEQSATLCNRMLETAKLGDNPPDWLENRYTRISHEEMSLNPLETAKKLYEFVDLPWTQGAEDFIYNTTIGAVGKSGTFGIGKVSTDVVTKWKKMSIEKIELITDACWDMIQYLGYENDMQKIAEWKEEHADPSEDT